MINSWSELLRNQRGAAAVELTLLVPALLLMLGLLVAGGRLWFARTTVNEAAQTAARAASLARSTYAATTAGREAGAQSLQTAGLRCRSTSVLINTAACNVDFSDVVLPGWPGSMELTGRGSAALDTYRSR
jgi:Flp pilus assembly protein TadG